MIHHGLLQWCDKRGLGHVTEGYFDPNKAQVYSLKFKRDASPHI